MNIRAELEELQLRYARAKRNHEAREHLCYRMGQLILRQMRKEIKEDRKLQQERT